MSFQNQILSRENCFHLARLSGYAVSFVFGMGLGCCLLAILVSKRPAWAEIPENSVMVPTYVELGKQTNQDANGGDDAADEVILPIQNKVQYVPITRDKPIFTKAWESRVIEDGAQYNDGEELLVAPGAHDFDTSDVPIVEKALPVQVNDAPKVERRSDSDQK